MNTPDSIDAVKTASKTALTALDSLSQWINREISDRRDANNIAAIGTLAAALAMVTSACVDIDNAVSILDDYDSQFPITAKKR